jgi:hypothetical protein
MLQQVPNLCSAVHQAMLAVSMEERYAYFNMEAPAMQRYADLLAANGVTAGAADKPSQQAAAAPIAGPVVENAASEGEDGSVQAAVQAAGERAAAAEGEVAKKTASVDPAAALKQLPVRYLRAERDVFIFKVS